MPRSEKLIKIISTIVLCSLILGCSGYNKYTFSEDTNLGQLYRQKASPIQIGDFVNVQTTDGLNFFGTVDLVNELGFKINGQQINYSSVESVQVREILWLPTIVVGVVSVFTLFLITYEPGKYSPH